MRGVVERGTATRAKVDGYQLSGKTGTTQDFRDAWFIGVMPNLAIGAYVGYDEPRSMGREMTGGRLVAPTIGGFLREYVTQFPVPREFRPPAGSLVVTVCAASRQIPGPRCESKLSLPFDAGSAPTQTCTHHQPEPEPVEYEDEEGVEGTGMQPQPRYTREEEDEEDAMQEVRF
jgi:penicillin-binding protein 1A